MPTVDKDTCWLDGNHFRYNYSIDGTTGEYFCNLPKPIAEKTGQKKLTAPALNMLKSLVREAIKTYQEAQSEEFCPDRRRRR